MKKLTLLFCLLPFFGFAQNYCSIGTRDVLDYRAKVESPRTDFAMGDSVYLYFTFLYTSGAPKNPADYSYPFSINTVLIKNISDAELKQYPSYGYLRYFFRITPQNSRYGNNSGLLGGCQDYYSFRYTVKTATGINESIEAKEIQSVEYYNLIGVKMPDTNTPGIYVVITTFTDGSVIRKKVWFN
jgi:hypothetical protein